MKSHASVLLELAECIYKDAVAKCTDVSLDARDLKTINSRFKHEGLSFLTITLPTIGRDLEEALSNRRIDSTLFRSFKKRAKAPAFLQGFFNQVFDSEGRLFDEPSIEAIEGIRQIAYTFKKLKVPCTHRRVSRALQKFVEVESIFQTPLHRDLRDDFYRVSKCLWNPLFHRIDVRSAIPRHGPGATAEKLSGNAKFSAKRWHDRLEPYFPLLDFKFANADGRFSKGFEEITIVPGDEEQPVRVIPVPKTLKGPRIIAIEPVCMQYAQQALSSIIVKILENARPTKGHVNFTDQSINRALAIQSSADLAYATIDMSSASDRVPMELASSMFSGNPDLRDAILACRSTRAQMPDDQVIDLKKFASMGSALCFPVEAMYFYTICVLALLKGRNLPISWPNICLVGRDIFVYGDDILVPTSESEIVADTLQKYYCKVNRDKSFSSGKFRESCGMDAYDGYEVTPTYLRHMRPGSMRNAHEIISWMATSNLFYRRGYWLTSNYIVKHVERVTRMKMPVVARNCSGLGKESYQSYVSTQRWGKRFQRHEIKTLVSCPVYQADIIDNDEALLKCLLTLESADPRSTSFLDGSVTDQKHLRRSARHGAVTLKRRWVSPY